ncbi:MAG: tetratricopeptide repeat protein [Euryarchaeota archaeon]|nr:tetratricopeptide repeat protein [Euryarchaeota archaeon]
MYVENIFGIDTRRGAVYKGDGHFYMTDKRLVGFRYYDPYGEASYWEQKYGRPIEVTEMPHKGFRIVGYIRDFIDIPLNEIVALDTKYSNLYILSNLIPYRCPISNELAEMIRIILDKKVVTRETKSAFPDKYERFYFVDPRSVAEAWKHENKHDKRWQMLQKAMSYEDEGKYEKAIDCYKKIIELFPDDTHSQKMIRALSNPRTLQGMSNASNATASLSLELNGGNQ